MVGVWRRECLPPRDGTSVSYSYIGANTDRFNKTVRGTTTQCVYDNGNVDEEMQGTTVTADYGANSEKLSGSVSWMLQDGQGITRQLLNSSQTVVASYISDAFGNSVSSSGSSANPFIWNGGSGYYSDAESGLRKVGARYYDPAVGRWISQDTLSVAGSSADSQAVNRYCYCGENPIAHVDPSGHFGNWWEFVGIFVVLLGLCCLLEAVLGFCVYTVGAIVLGMAMIAIGAYSDYLDGKQHASYATANIPTQATIAGLGPGDGYPTK